MDPFGGRTRPDGGSGVKAVVFDIDGTLYRQGPLRRAMISRLASAHAAQPIRGWRTFRVLRAYRRAQEELRALPAAASIAEAQIALTCERTNVGRDAVVECIARWMEQEPLPFLAQCLQPGVAQFLAACRARGLRLAALSDYPADAKLQALGLSGLFELALSAQSPEVNVFKPDPRGLLLALERLGADRSEGLYVGDRADVDAPTASAAGVRCAILTDGRSSAAGGSYMSVSSYQELHDVLWPHTAQRTPPANL
jgi:putative hydrolase of the HAD superfamily